MRGPESRVEDFLRDEFKRHGWLVYKMDQGGGVADRLCISPSGFHLWVELKKPGKNTLDPKQIAWQQDMEGRIAEALDISRFMHIRVVGPVNSREQVTALRLKYQ